MFSDSCLHFLHDCSGAGAHLFRSWATYINRSIILTPEVPLVLLDMLHLLDLVGDIFISIQTMKLMVVECWAVSYCRQIGLIRKIRVLLIHGKILSFLGMLKMG